MIRAIMLGRLGNNLFQYAFGRALAEKHGVSLILDGALFNAADWRQVSALKRLPLNARIARPFSLISRTLKKTTGRHPLEFLGLPILKEKDGDHRFNPSLLDAPADCVLSGYFQGPLYFLSIEETLRTEINLDGVVDPQPRVEDAMGEYDSVAVHVRRTDFLSQPVFQVCDEAYYCRAMEKMRARLKNPRFFIFSDDPEWCRIRFTASDEEVVEISGASTDPLIDLHFMSRAKHQIIANSSYSWWAAWLGKSDGQMVLTPDRWFASEIIAPIEEKLLSGWEAMVDETEGR